ncbi:alpha/beta fold hydrolase [Sporichthya sp.]|uniref:alpha/beta fold hydrolase n=1 Tax=Sporichthya sp. TaxID=65475 RepID=UPI0017C2FE99|nr:alpha/beta hydrolase [Sporichthya sp.]MBA3743639.1 alpha/beta fold hydrolase [Sporichthya sp.]
MAARQKKIILEHTRTGEGPPLVLLHGVGGRREMWDPIVPLLAPHREVITIDLPGFGASKLTDGQDLKATGYAQTVADFCAQLGLERPHYGGNSLGGWVSLEIAKAGRAASVTGIAPAGLWRRRVPRYTKWQVMGIHDLPKRLGPLMPPLMRVPPLRVALTANVMGKPWKTPRTVLMADSAAMLASEAFKLTLASASGQRFCDGHDIEVPITIAFGTRDVILGPGCRYRGELPAHTRWLSPRGWGHVPMYDDRKGVAAVLLDGSSISALAA